MQRPYQQRGNERVQQEFAKGFRRVLLVSPTGSGKTVQAVWMMDQALKKGKSVLFVCDRDILVSQTAEALDGEDIDFGVIKAGWDESRSSRMQVASIQSLMNRDLPPADFIIFDEAHERLDQQLWLAKKYPEAYILGLTATPFRSDGRSFASVYESLVVNTTPKELIKLGFLVPERVFAPARISTKGVRVNNSSGDYVQEELAKAVSDMKIIGKAVDAWKKHADGMMTMVFCVNVAHGKKVAKAFCKAGVPAEIVTGTVGEEERKAIIARFRAKETLVLVNVEVYVKGANIPEIECVADLAPTLSLARYIQKIGRAGRPYPGKEYFLQLDHAGNSLRHGFWSDDREYSLGTEKNQRESEYIPSTKMCPECFYVMLSSCTSCEVCDYIFPVTVSAPKEVDGELEEVINEDVKVFAKDGKIHYNSKAEGSGNFALDASKDYWSGSHTIKREKNSYNLYGKRTTDEDFFHAINWILQKETGSKPRRFLIEKIIEAKKKGYSNQWPFLQYKRQYKHFPKMK